MSLPANWSTVTVTGTYLNVDGDPLKGTVAFSTTTRVVDAGANVTVPPGVRQVSLDKDGTFSVVLPATDDPDVSPSGFTYRVDENLVLPSGVRSLATYLILLPAATPTVDLADVVPVTAVAEVSPYLRAVDLAAEVARADRTYVPRRDASFLARGALMFSLDDGRAQNADLVALHEAYGQRITLGVVSDWVDDPGRLTSAQVLDFHNRGHEIANHTQTHANYTAITAAQRATESDTCSGFIEALTGVRPVSYIYPQGSWSVTTDRELYGRFRSWAATLSPTTNLPPINRLGDTFPRYYRVDLDQVANLDRALELVRLAARAPVVVAFYTHWTDQPGTMTTAQYQSIAQLAYDLGVPAVLPRDMFGGFSALADSSFEVPGMPNWLPSVTGASAATAQVTDTPDAGLAGTKVVSLTATNPDTAYRSQAIWCQPNTTYRISGRLRCPSGTLATNDVAVRIRWRLADESAISTASVLPAISGTGWTRFEGDLTSPALARMALVDCYLGPGIGRGGTAYLDHIDVRPAEQGGLG